MIRFSFLILIFIFIIIFVYINIFLYLYIHYFKFMQLKITDQNLNLPEEVPDSPYSDEFLKSLHHAIMEVRQEI